MTHSSPLQTLPATPGRPLSSVEQLVWTISRRMPLNFAVAVRLRGYVSLPALTAAAAAVRNRYLGLVSRVVRDATGRLQFTTADVPNLPVTEIVADQDDAWQRIVERELALPFDSITGPFARFVLVRRGEVSELLAVCDHCVSDGLSAVNLLRDVLVELAEPSNESDAAEVASRYPPSLVELLLPEVLADREVQLVRHWGVRLAPWLLRWHRFVQRWRSRPMIDATAIVDQPSLTELQNALSQRGVKVTTWTLSPELTTALQHRSRQEATTVHMALLVAWARAVHESPHDGQRRNYRIETPLNARKRLQVEASAGAGLYNLLTYTSVAAEVRRDFWQAARDARRALEQATTDGKLFGGIMCLDDWIGGQPPKMVNELAALVDLDSHQHVISISNLGRVDFRRQYGPLEVEAVYGPCVLGQGSVPVIGVATHNGRMTFAMSGLSDVPLQSTAMDCVPRFLQHLEDACRR